MPPIMFNAIRAPTGFTEASGATRLIPGSHRRDRAPAYGRHYPSAVADMTAGSVLIFDTTLWHGGGANRTDRRRTGIACYYCAGWIPQQENLQRGLPRERVAGSPPKLQDLYGYGVHKGRYGHIEGRSPGGVLLDPRPERGMVWDTPLPREPAAN